jgi:hypothetical protein
LVSVTRLIFLSNSVWNCGSFHVPWLDSRNKHRPR